MRARSMFLGFGLGLGLGFIVASIAATTATNLGLSITIFNPLVIAANPTAPMVACNAPPGTPVAALATSGGDGNAITWMPLTGSSDFSQTGANLTVGSNGIAPGHCPVAPALSAAQTVTITASQE